MGDDAAISSNALMPSIYLSHVPDKALTAILCSDSYSRLFKSGRDENILLPSSGSYSPAMTFFLYS